MADAIKRICNENKSVSPLFERIYEKKKKGFPPV